LVSIDPAPNEPENFATKALRLKGKPSAENCLSVLVAKLFCHKVNQIDDQVHHVAQTTGRGLQHQG
jgi:hypothetical protein